MWTPGFKKLMAYAGVAVGILGCGIAVAADSGFLASGSQSAERLASERVSSSKVQVGGNVRGLYPGATKQMRVRVRNGYPHAIRIVSVRARDGGANATCTSEYLSAKRFRGRVQVKPGRTARVKMRVSMSATAPDSCQGASFPLRFRARVAKP